MNEIKFSNDYNTEDIKLFVLLLEKIGKIFVRMIPLNKFLEIFLRMTPKLKDQNLIEISSAYI